MSGEPPRMTFQLELGSETLRLGAGLDSQYGTGKARSTPYWWKRESHESHFVRSSATIYIFGK